MAPFTCLISGANRGIGYALVAQYLACNNTVVVAAVRSPASATSLSLSQLPTGTGSSLILIPYDSTSEDITRTGIDILKEEKGVNHLDLVIANAGIPQNQRGGILGAEIAEMEQLVRTNGLGPIILFRQTLSLMRNSKLSYGATFVNIGSTTGSSTGADLTNMLQLAPMGVSKACGMMSTVLLSVEAPDITSFSICPGGVATDAFKQVHGSEDISHLENVATPEQAAEGVIKLINSSTHKTHHGGFFDSTTGNKVLY